MNPDDFEHELAAVDPNHIIAQVEAQKAAQVEVLHDYVYWTACRALDMPTWLAALLTAIRAGRY